MYKKYKLILAGTSKKAKVNITEHNIKNKQQVQMKTQLLECYGYCFQFSSYTLSQRTNTHTYTIGRDQIRHRLIVSFLSRLCVAHDGHHKTIYYCNQSKYT